MKPAPNATWDVHVQTLREGSKNPLVVSSLREKRQGIKNLSLPSKGEERQQKGIETNCSDKLVYSIRGPDSCSSLVSTSTETSCRDSSRKSTRSQSESPSISSRKSASRKSKSKRKQRRKTSSTSKRVPYEPARKPRKSCIKKLSKPSSLQQSPPRRQGSFHDVHLPGHLGTVERQRTIMFNEQVYVRQFRSSLSLAKNDPHVLWWQDDEHALIKENLQKLVCRVDKNGVARRSGKKYCTRGLERFLDPDTDYEGERLAAEDDVLHEQSMQRDSRTFDDLSIAAVYVRSTKASLRRALRYGYEDAMVAASILKEDVGSSSSSLFRTSLSSGDLDVSKGRSALLKAPHKLPKRSVSFSSLSGRAAAFRRKSKQERQEDKLSTRNQAMLQHRPTVPSMA